MNKIEFMAFSLPYGLKCETIKGFIYELLQIDICEHLFYGQSEIDIDCGYYPYYANNSKPILRNLSDLTKEIEHGGEKFVPINKLPIIGNECMSIIDDIYSGWIRWSEIQKLIEWKFDIANLIEKGEAIDVNTLEINPYK